MSAMDKKKNESEKDKINKGKETNSTDPQEKMEGPVSSLVQGIKEEAEQNDSESKEEADERKDKNT